MTDNLRKGLDILANLPAKQIVCTEIDLLVEKYEELMRFFCGMQRCHQNLSFKTPHVTEHTEKCKVFRRAFEPFKDEEG